MWLQRLFENPQNEIRRDPCFLYLKTPKWDVRSSSYFLESILCFARARYRLLCHRKMAAAEEPPKTGECDMGMYGLAVMGQNFALNMASKG